MASSTIVIYTDGACSGNPGPGGWAWAVVGGPYASGAAAHTTNQRMEIQAAYEAVLANGSEHEPVEIVSDSTYVVNCFRDRWWEGWIKRGWKNSQRQPVANRDLWEPFIEVVRARRNVGFRWVKGHSGDPMNDFVDQLAVEAGVRQQGATGTMAGVGSPASRLPTVAVVDAVDGAPDDPDAPHDVVVLGHADRPVDAARGGLAVAIADRAATHPTLRVVTGLRKGAEHLGAEVARGEGVPLFVVLPFPDPHLSWADDDRTRFEEARDWAESWIVLEDATPSSPQSVAAALRRRDRWLTDNTHEALVVWDGEDDRIGRLYRSMVDVLGADRVEIIDPGPVTARLW